VADYDVRRRKRSWKKRKNMVERKEETMEEDYGRRKRTPCQTLMMEMMEKLMEGKGRDSDRIHIMEGMAEVATKDDG
jgi:hypothetical protein